MVWYCFLILSFVVVHSLFITYFWSNIMKYSWGRTFDNTMEKRKYGSEEVFRKEFEKAVSVNLF